ncbi:hypothetical protein L1887_21130 [Cichorium endivia]|nr:hypothetical protein L1887_21130 [Cichorium endivia]
MLENWVKSCSHPELTLTIFPSYSISLIRRPLILTRTPSPLSFSDACRRSYQRIGDGYCFIMRKFSGTEVRELITGNGIPVMDFGFKEKKKRKLILGANGVGIKIELQGRPKGSKNKRKTISNGTIPVMNGNINEEHSKTTDEAPNEGEGVEINGVGVRL